MSMPTVVVTGANRGLGLVVSRSLVREGCSVVLVARDVEGGRRALRDLSALGDVRLVAGDLSSVRSTREAARAILATRPTIDVLVHNAGVWPSRLETNEDGVERAFAVNHLAPFLLNHLLGPALPAGARIVQVSAGLYVKGRVDPARTPYGADFHVLRTYPTTKLCNLLLLERFAEHFAARRVTINAVHPGVLRTGLGDRPGLLGFLLRGVKRSWAAPEEGVAPVVRLARAPELARVTGRYFHLEEEMPLAAPARDRALAAVLWQQAETLCGTAMAGHHARADANASRDEGDKEAARDRASREAGRDGA